MIESTIGGNGKCVNRVIITNLEAISSHLDQSEDAPSFPNLAPSARFVDVIEFLSSSFSDFESHHPVSSLCFSFYKVFNSLQFFSSTHCQYWHNVRDIPVFVQLERNTTGGSRSSSSFSHSTRNNNPFYEGYHLPS